MDSFLSNLELAQLGLKSYGQRVMISKYARIYNPQFISIGDNVRIDDFCILSGNITIGSNIHISAYVAIYGKMGVVLEDYTGISPKSVIYSAMDDFSGEYLIGPIHNESLTNVTGGAVILKRYSQIGASSVVFPNLIIGEGSIIGAYSLVNRSTDDWGMYWGIPAVKHKERKRNLLNLIK